MNARSYGIGGALLLLLLAAAGLWWYGTARPPAASRAAPPVTLPVTQAPQASGPAAPTALAPAIAHPIEPAAASAPGAAPRDVDGVLSDLFGRKAVLSLFQTQDFARRFVATVDNLGRTQATSRLWPVNPAQGKFTVSPRDGGQVIGADNGLRYTPQVLLLEAVDPAQLAAAYVQLYPRFQQAYAELGFPQRYFNDRLVEVIDLLLATPEPAAPVGVHLLTVNSPVQPVRPWVLWAFDDPGLQALSAGQKILLRMGPVNERRVKTRLKALRRLVATGDVAR